MQGVGVWEAQLGKGKDSCECEPVFRTDGGGTGICLRMVGRCVTLAVTNETDQAEHVEPRIEAWKWPEGKASKETPACQDSMQCRNIAAFIQELNVLLLCLLHLKGQFV